VFLDSDFLVYLAVAFAVGFVAGAVLVIIIVFVVVVVRRCRSGRLSRFSV